MFRHKNRPTRTNPTGFLGRHCQASTSNRPKSSKLKLEALEERRLLDVAAAMDGGLLSITSDVDEDIVLSAQAQVVGGSTVYYVQVNGGDPARPGGGSTLASEVLGIEIADSPFGNLIDVTAINPERFAALNSPVTVNAGDGDDTVHGSNLDDLIDLGDGNDVVDAGMGDDSVFGGLGDDEFRVEEWDDGGEGHGDDYLDGGVGDDIIDGGEGSDTLLGGAGADVIDGGEGTGSDDDVIFGGAGDDVITDERGSGILLGGDGADAITNDGGEGSISVGGLDADTLVGGSGRDILLAGRSPYDSSTIDIPAFQALLSEWTAWGKPYEEKATNLTTVGAAGENFPFYLAIASLQDDGAVDELTGRGNRDFFLGELSNNIIQDHQPNEWIGSNQSIPAALDDILYVVDGTTSVPASFLLTNDGDGTGGALTIASLPTPGPATLSGDQSTITIDWTGIGLNDPAEFTYLVSNGTSTSFHAAQVKVYRSANEDATLLGDATGDALTDVIGFNAQSGTITVTPNRGSEETWGTVDTAKAWKDAIAADFNYDGQIDVAARDGGSGEWNVWLSNGTVFASPEVWGNWHLAGQWLDALSGDFNGDGRDDIFGLDARTADFMVGASTGSEFSISSWGNAYSTIQEYLSTYPIGMEVGDFDGNRRDDLLVYDAQSSQWAFVLSEGVRFTQLSLPQTFAGWTHHYVGDFDGDGSTDLLGYHDGNDRWEIARFSDGQFSPTPMPWATSIVDPAGYLVQDLNDDGRDDLAKRASVADDWMVLLSTNNGFLRVDTAPWGASSPFWEDALDSAAWNVSGVGDIIDQTFDVSVDLDTDRDGLADGYEQHTLGTDETEFDSDGDRLGDGDEVNLFGTDPRSINTAGDYCDDYDEIHVGMPPLETLGGGASDDFDGDGLSNSNELVDFKTNPGNADSDQDGLTDLQEKDYGFDPWQVDDLSFDADGDGLTTQQELSLPTPTNPGIVDSDGDQLADGVEVH